MLDIKCIRDNADVPDAAVAMRSAPAHAQALIAEDEGKRLAALSE